MLSVMMSKEIEELRDVIAYKSTTIDVDDEEDVDVEKGEVKVGEGVKLGLDIKYYFLYIFKVYDCLLYVMVLFRLGLCKKKAFVFVSSVDVVVRL